LSGQISGALRLKQICWNPTAKYLFFLVNLMEIKGCHEPALGHLTYTGNEEEKK
jgi:hypothetical protein